MDSHRLPSFVYSCTIQERSSRRRIASAFCERGRGRRGLKNPPRIHEWTLIDYRHSCIRVLSRSDLRDAGSRVLFASEVVDGHGNVLIYNMTARSSFVYSCAIQE